MKFYNPVRGVMIVEKKIAKEMNLFSSNLLEGKRL
jgi:hypothetical protein